MNSAHNPEAKRRSSQRSGGPSTARGKAVSRQNALRHGLASTMLTAPSRANRIETMARAIVKYGGATVQYDQAVDIAEAQMVIGGVRAARVAAIERKKLADPPLQTEVLAEHKPTAATNDDFEALALALPELLRLERYERRAFPRRRRAMRMISRRIIDAAFREGK